MGIGSVSTFVRADVNNVAFIQYFGNIFLTSSGSWRDVSKCPAFANATSLRANIRQSFLDVRANFEHEK
jgi:hypothetical protein